MRVLPIKLPGLELQVLKIEKGTLTLIHERIGKKPAEVTIDETEFRALIEAVGENDNTGHSMILTNTSTFGLEVNLAMCTGAAKIVFQRDDGTVSECAFSSSGPLAGGPVMVSAWTLTKSRLSDSTDTDIKEIKVAFSASTSGLTTPASPAETDFQPPAITLTPPAKHEETIAISVEAARKGKKRANLKVREPTPEPMEDVDEVDGDPLSRRFLYMACVSQVHNPTCDIMVEAVLQIDRRHGTLQYGGIPGWNADKLPKRAIALTKMSKSTYILDRPERETRQHADQIL